MIAPTTHHVGMTKVSMPGVLRIMHTPQPRQPPHSVNQIISFGDHNKHVVLAWLVAHMSDDCTLKHHNASAVDNQGYWRWRMSLKASDNRVWLEREEDVNIFILTWC